MTMRKTYTLELDGKPAVIFRAKDDSEATLFATDDTTIYAYLFEHYYHPNVRDRITVRLATIPEQAEWRAGSIMQTTTTNNQWQREPDTYVRDLRRVRKASGT